MHPRHELKHIINQGDYLALRSRLRQVAQADPHAGSTGRYLVRSIYFDNYRDQALTDKLAGAPRRDKYRIRFYNDDLSTIKLEKKSKDNSLYTKLATPLSFEQCQQLFANDLQWMLETEDPLLGDFYVKLVTEKLMPKTVVEYLREPYVYLPGNVRVTFDSDVRSGLYSREVFDAHLPLLPASTPGEVIMELKYDSFLPSVIADALQIGNRRSQAISKYVLARSFE